MARPSKLDTINLSQVEALATKGWTDVEMADFFGVTEKTWHNWKKKNEEFLQSLKDWKLVADNRVEVALYARAVGYSHPDTHISSYQGEVIETDIIKHYPPDPTSCIFWLKNRKQAEWRDKQEIDNPSAITPVQLMQAFNEVAKSLEQPQTDTE